MHNKFTIEHLRKKLNLNKKLLEDIYSSNPKFPLLVPENFISCIQPNNINDPLLRQILPTKVEQQKRAAYAKDPLAEKQHSPMPGLIHKYAGRALLAVTAACPINCRFCFRRYHRPAIIDWQKALNYLGNKPKIKEIILSGGDPLFLPTTKITSIIKNLSRISHIMRLRIHTRIPIVAPKIITTSLIKTISRFRLKPIIVIHCNHPNEINKTVANAIIKLKKSGLIVLNQTVLLKNINDNANTLANLSEKLFNLGVIPYYLHLLDKVAGARHFEVTIKEAQKIFHSLHKQLPGYLVPRLVQDEATGLAKKLII